MSGSSSVDMRYIRSMSGSSPVDVRYIRSMSGRSPAANNFQRTWTDAKRISTGQGTYEYRAKRTSAHWYRTSNGCRYPVNGCLYPVASVPSFEHAQNFLPDKTDITGHRRTRNANAGRETDMERIWTDTNGLKILLSVRRPFPLSGDVWLTYKHFMLCQYHISTATADTKTVVMSIY